MLRVRTLASLLIPFLFLTACGKSKKPIIVGGKNSTEQTIVGEIIAQHLENRLKQKIQRNLNAGATLIVYQSLVAGQLTLYPEYTGTIEAEILKEQPPADAQMLYERSKGELARLSQLELLPSLGYGNPPVIAVRTEDAQKYKLSTLSEAAASDQKWKMAVSYEFQQRKDAIPAINSYKLPMAAGIRGLEASLLFAALERNEVNMIAVDATDSGLSSPTVTVLTDDKKAFPAYQACILARQDALMDEPQLRPALQELSGKISLEQIRKMAAEMDQQHKPAAEIAQSFLASAGLK
jgi:glycine betaine/choline ABC-type transport system substrate-binding protein